MLMAPLWLAYKTCLLALKISSAACLLPDAVDRSLDAVRQRRVKAC